MDHGAEDHGGVAQVADSTMAQRVRTCVDKASTEGGEKPASEGTRRT
jgi:hypothetical protein